MKITKRQLRKIIKEEKQKLISESSMEQSYQYAEKILEDAIKELAGVFSDGQLGNGALDAKMNGNTVIYEMLSQAALIADEFAGNPKRSF
tara:strand:- start:10640 stop:10909 length:270 start_codon:yes stop_codon:yes gene_type:complete